MEKLSEILGVSGVLVFIGLLWCLCPMVVLWSINVIAEESRVTMYIPHTFWTYLATILIVLAFRKSSD